MRALAFLLLLWAGRAAALGQDSIVLFQSQPDLFAVVAGNQAAPIIIATDEDWGVRRAAADLQSDIEQVTGVKPVLLDRIVAKEAILVGRIGHNAAIDGLIAAGKLNVEGIKGSWEGYVIQRVEHPMAGLDSALVVAGSDKRGAMFGLYELSEQFGVSPWTWWADVPVPRHAELYVAARRTVGKPPSVKYRGIFLNDEAPALSGWAKERYGTLDHRFYERVFELILRLRGNFLWPAMWGNAFNEDDPLNPQLADKYGVVMSTSHHEPMLRAQQEWKRHGAGPWNYRENGEVLRQFWAEGVRRNRDYESVTTIGMRGDGDMPMTASEQEADTQLLETIVADQRRIIAEQVNPDLTKVPQVWALYKEVQLYYEHGMRVPDDVTLLWCDDNWGNVRRLPTEDEKKRSGGAGIYYHFDYVGDPRNYKWINTNPIAKVWEQMSLSYQFGADRLWVVNVGDLKPMEFPIEFFLTLARDPQAWPAERLGAFTNAWATREFGAAEAAEIAELVTRYGMLIGRRKPELLSPETFSLTDYQEADRVVAEYRGLLARAEAVNARLPANRRDAFFELVLHPIKAADIVTELYIAAGKNRLYAAQGRASARYWAEQTRALFAADAKLTDQYNHQLAGGKWNHMMDQTHIGYTSWQQPPANVMPVLAEPALKSEAGMGLALEGGGSLLPAFDLYGASRHFIDIFNQGQASFTYTAKVDVPWIRLDQPTNKIGDEARLWLSLDAGLAPAEGGKAHVTISGAGSRRTIEVSLAPMLSGPIDGFVESNGVVAIEAEHYSAKRDGGFVAWEKIPDYGRTLSGMASFPVTAASTLPGDGAARLDYRLYLRDAGPVSVDAVVGPSLNFVPGRGLRYGIAFDDEEPQIVDILAGETRESWSKAVSDAVRHGLSRHRIAASGWHRLSIWRVDPGLVIERLLVDRGGLRPSYLGPPESFHGAAP